MAKWTAKVIGNPAGEIKLKVQRALPKALNDLKRWAATDLVKAMVHGGMGIEGIEQTDFYRFISSPEGLSQLGIPASEPKKLLKAYKTSAFKVQVRNDTISIEFGNVAALKAATKHPAAGTGHLTISSWLEWVLENKEVGRGFVPRRKVLGKAQGAIRLKSPLGGLMLPRGVMGSSGLWRFPTKLKNFEEKWLGRNANKIEDAMIDKFSEFLNKRIVSG